MSVGGWAHFGFTQCFLNYYYSSANYFLTFILLFHYIFKWFQSLILDPFISILVTSTYLLNIYIFTILFTSRHLAHHTASEKASQGGLGCLSEGEGDKGLGNPSNEAGQERSQ
jgi:hypothetical protein